MPPSNKIGHTNSTVFLRQITVWTFLPASVLFIIHGTGSGWAFPAVGLIPLATSALMGLLLLHRDRVAAFGSPIQALTPSNIFFADGAVTVFLLVCLIPTWACLGRPYESGMVVLGTYCSVFMMLNFGIHFYFTAAEALHIITARTSPFRSLAAEYTPLTDDYRDDPDEPEQAPETV